MTTRFEDFFSITASFLHFPELPAIKETSDTLYSLATEAERYTTFYGLKLPDPVNEPLFYDLFSKNYASLEARILVQEDLKINYNYYGRDSMNNYIPSMYRADIYNKQWNCFTLMEIAYMIGDFNAYQLLSKHERNTTYERSDFRETYNSNSCNLLELFDETTKIKKLYDLRPKCYDSRLDLTSKPNPF